MATSPGTLPPARPSTSKVSNELSSARCHVFRGKKHKLPKDATVSKAKKQSESHQARSNINFKFSAGSPASPVPMPATNTARQTTLATRVNGRNSVSYFHHLQKKIKIISSQVDSYQHELEKIIRVLRRKLDVYTLRLSRLLESTRMTASLLGSASDDDERAFQHFNAELVKCNEDLNKRIIFMLAKVGARHDEVNRQTERLNSILAPCAQELDMQSKLLDFKTASYYQGVERRMAILKARYSAFCLLFGSQFDYIDM